MRIVKWLAAAWFLVGFVGLTIAQEATQPQDKKVQKKPDPEKTDKVVSKITVFVPPTGHKETVLSISGSKTSSRGEERKFVTPPLDKGNHDYKYEFKAIIEPNNYTTITRIKTVTFKAGEDVIVDLRNEDEKTDKIEVRWVPTPDDIVDKMCAMAKVGKNDVVYDLGCGDAVMLIRPIKQFNAKRGVGIDIDPKILEMAKKNVEKAGLAEKIQLRVGDILDVKDMADADVVLLYIGDDLGKRLGPVLQKTMKPGSRIVSLRFSLGTWKATRQETVTGEDGVSYDLLLWIVPEKK